MTPGVGRTHILVSLLLLAICAAAGAAIDFAARSRRVGEWFDARAEAQTHAIGRAYVHQGEFGDAFNGLILIDAPQNDYDAGGVYFFGSSNLVFAAQFNNLPPEQQRLIHNFGFPAANPTQIRQFIEYLEREHHFLSRGSTRMCVVIALTENDLVEEPGAGWFLPSALRDTGVFEYDSRAGISLVPMTGWERSWMIRKLRWYELAVQLQRMTTRLPPAPGHADVDGFKKEVERLNVTNPPGALDRQLNDLSETLDLLKAHHVDARVIRLPKGSWADGSALDQAFAKAVPSLCAARGAAYLDISHLLSDDEFMDAHHPNQQGAPNVRDALEKFALERLEQGIATHAR